MTLQQIHYVLTIARAGSMNKAAEQLFVSQPSLTSAVKELEKEIGLSIFTRTSRGMIVTNEGADFLMYARQLYQQYELIQEKYSSDRNYKRKFSVSTQHYSFAVKAFVETVRKLGTSDFEFGIFETRTRAVIADVGNLRSEIGVLYLSDFNRKAIGKLLRDHDLEFHELIRCSAYIYMWRGHPLAKEASLTLKQLEDYPCLAFDQGEEGSYYLTEEIMTEKEYPRTIKASDRATMLNLMVGLNGYILCSGIINEELNGDAYVAVPFRGDRENRNAVMTIGYITRKRSPLSDIGRMYVDEMKRYLDGVNNAERGG